jgi:3-hydroxyisobutyrate dehydrogenase-like beta-hydroxyacid dehydrogenase
MNVGFIGLGTMGQGMAANLLKSGLALTVFNRTRSKADKLVEQGARFAGSMEELGECDAVFTMVSDDRALRSICFEQGLLDSIKPGAAHISSSTISLELARELITQHADRSQEFVGAPVSGRGDFAREGRLFVITAGKAEVVTRCKPLFEAIGQKSMYFGDDPTAAVIVKLAVNLMIAGTIGIIAEAYNMVGRFGIAKTEFHDFVTSGLFSAPVFHAYGGMIASDQYQPANFPTPLGLKDLKLALAAAEETATPLPIGSVVRDELLATLARGYHDLDWSSLALAMADALAPAET